MIGTLPTSLTIHDKTLKINSDFRYALVVISALSDANLTDQDKAYIMLDAILGIENIEYNDMQEAMAKVKWYLDGGVEHSSTSNVKLMDWEQDEQMIFSAVNKVAGVETRVQTYIHWWTFLGYFNEINEGLFSTVVGIRQKKAKGKKLDKHEEEFYRKNKALIDLKTRYSDEEQDEIDKLKEIFK